MKNKSASIRIGMLCLCAALVASACSAQGNAGAGSNQGASSTQSASASTSANSSIGSGVNVAQAQRAVPAMANPSGDIPDSQQFIAYISKADAYKLEVPEGWARTENGANVQFVNHYDGLWVHVSSQSQAPSVASVQANQVKTLEASGLAVKVTKITAVTIDNRNVIRVAYDSNSKPNAVTNKQVRLENNAYFYYSNGRLAELRMWAPFGADNVDQWRRMSRSFRWR